MRLLMLNQKQSEPLLPPPSTTVLWRPDYSQMYAASTGGRTRVIISSIGLAKPDPLGAQDVSQKLEYIADAFELQVVRMAELLGVSRQAIYDWKQGKGLGEENHRKLNALHRAAQGFKEAGLEANYNTKHQLIGGEVEFIDALALDPEDAVAKLVKVTAWSKPQREWLDNLLSDRPEPSGFIFDDLPPHYPGE